MRYTRVKTDKIYRGIYKMFDKQTSWVGINYRSNEISGLMLPGITHYIEEGYIYGNLSGCLFNFNTEEELQLEKMGFILSDDEKNKACELLIFYIINRASRNPCRIGVATGKLIQMVMKKRGLIKAYATCLPSVGRFYCRFGAEIKQKIHFGDKILCLIQFSLR